MKNKMFNILVGLGLISSSSFAGSYEVLTKSAINIDEISTEQRPIQFKQNAMVIESMLEDFDEASDEQRAEMFKNVLEKWSLTDPPACGRC